MTQEQATEIRIYLINQLNQNGFSDIVSEINTRLEQNYDVQLTIERPSSVLRFFLEQSIEVFNGISNKNYPELIKTLNQYIDPENPVENIYVEPLDEGELVPYDLKDLPNYQRIITEFQEVLEEINREN